MSNFLFLELPFKMLEALQTPSYLQLMGKRAGCGLAHANQKLLPNMIACGVIERVDYDRKNKKTKWYQLTPKGNTVLQLMRIIKEKTQQEEV